MCASLQNDLDPANDSQHRHPLLKKVLSLIAIVAAGITAYSIYVAIHEPDPQETVILGQKAVAAASPAAWRILVRHRASLAPVRGANVKLALTDKSSGIIKLGTFRTDTDGTVPDSVNIPEIAPGEYELVVDVNSSLGRDHISKKVEVQHPTRILLSSDKPLYQPGQTIHLRGMVLNARTQKPFTNQPVTFEVSDPKGNKIFKETHKLSSFGIASADFVLATELNLGRYEIRAIAGPATAEHTVEVKRYVLPKFKTSVTTDKSYYLPGQTVSGFVDARYFFGKPLNDATVKLSASTLTVPELHGHIDANGRYSFQFQLPAYFVGLPQNNEQAWLDLTAEVTDGGGQVEQKMSSLSIAQNELEISAIPEAGTMVPGVENLVYVLTSYPDGRPAVCRVFLDGKAYECDAQGVSVIKVSPERAGRPMKLQALDSAGRKASLKFSPETTNAPPSLLVRTDKAVYQAGEAAQLTMLSSEDNNTIFLDVVKEGQTVLTKSVALKNHQAHYTLDIPSSLVGALKINAYLITQAGEDRGRSRLIYVNPASALQIKSHLSKPVFRPGEPGKIEFSIVDAQGQPAPAALGISAVDESVFALAENRPGLLQQFLDAEADLLKPRYQIKSFSDPAQFLSDTHGEQRLAQAYFSAWSEPQTSAVSLMDSLVKGNYLTPGVLERIRSMRGTPDYESLRKDPQYGPILSRIEGEAHGTYTLQEATGPAKLQAVEAQRLAYFKALKKYLMIALCSAIFLLPICMIIYYLSAAAKNRLGTFATVQTARYATVASSTYHVLAALTLCPLVCYPLGGMFLAQLRVYGEHAVYSLLAFEFLIVAVTIAWQWDTLRKAIDESLQREVLPLRVGIGFFLLQFCLSRSGIVLATLGSRYDFEDFMPLLLLASLAAPLIVLGGLGSYIRKEFAAKGMDNKIARVTALDILIVITIVIVLAGLMLPALAKAKSKAVRISLMSNLKQVDLAERIADEDNPKSETGTSTITPASPRVRRDFPETLLWQPELITDDNGKATLEFPLADSITTWRASVDAINLSGKMGSAEVPIPVFQDFFVDLDLPVSLSLDDEVSIPVTCYNYLQTSQNVRLKLGSANWFECAAPVQSVNLAAGEVKSVRFSIRVRLAGNHTLRVTAQGPKTSDAVEREINVLPTGQKIAQTKNEVLKQEFMDAFEIPINAVPASASLWMKFYPSRFSEVVEGLDSIFQAPYGCFEQTSSTTYPNMLVLDYMKRMGRLTPEIEVKARKYINAGYQRLLTFEVPGGGFEWFGRNPANICLTAYGILEFTDMARVHPVDEAVISRARQWLFSKQNGDGSWDEIHRGWTWEGRGSITAFVAYALAEAGDDSLNLRKALDYLRDHPEELSNTYGKALAANAFLAHDRKDAFGLQLAKDLKALAIKDNDHAIHWTSSGYSISYSHDFGMEAEVTALASMALMKAGMWPQSVKQGLTWISNHKFANGTLGSTQATILAMRALLAGSSASLGQEFESSVTLVLNGEAVKTFKLNKDNSDVMQQVDLTSHLRTGQNRLEIRQQPAGELPFQKDSQYWLPEIPGSNLARMSQKPEPLQIDVQYDRTKLAVNDRLGCTVTVRNNTGTSINMAMVDLGIPPGFDVDSSAFESLQQSGQIAKFEITGNQVILYLRALAEVNPFKFTYSLRAKYPLRVQTPASVVYEYYQPANRAESSPVKLEVVSD